MKYDKINQDVLKRMVKEKEVMWCKDDTWFYLMMENKCGIWKVHKFLWYLDLATEGPSRNNIRKFDNMVKFFDIDYEKVHPLEKTVEYTTLPKGKKAGMVRVFTNRDGEKIYIDNDMLAYFDETYARFYGSAPNAPLYVFEGGDCVGCILPINRRGA